MATAKPASKAASAPMDKTEAEARRQAKEMKDQKANTKAYDAAVSTYKKGGMVKATPKATPYMCGGKVK